MTAVATPWGMLRRTQSWVGLTLLLIAYGLYTGFTAGQITNDEAWILRVAQRLLDGDVLYRDVFFGATPLSMYLVTAVAFLTGVEISAVKIVLAFCFVSSTLLACRLALQLGLGRTALTMVVLTQLAFVPSWIPGAGSPYTPLAYVFFLGSFSAFLTWRALVTQSDGLVHKSAADALAWAGFLAGLCFATKQSLGLYALAGLSAAVLATESPTAGRRLAGDWLRLALAWVTPAALFLLPVWLSGGLPRFLDYALLNKTTYARLAAIPYHASLAALISALARPWSLANVADVYEQLQLLLPFPTFVLLLYAIARAPLRRMAVVVSILTGAGFADVFPRVSTTHMSCMLALLTVAMLWAGREAVWRERMRLRLAGFGFSGLFLVAGIAYWTLNPVAGVLNGDLRPSDLAHLRGPLLPVSELKTLHAQAVALQSVGQDGRLFIVSSGASRYYLMSGLQNPTPFDYPLATAFGLTGEADVVADLQAGHLQTVCWMPMGTHPLRPATLEAYIREHMEAVRDLGACTLYRRRG